MMKYRSGITAGELMALLESDPAWVAARAEEDRKHAVSVAKRREELRPEQNPLLKKLKTLGYDVPSVWTLVNTKDSYPSAIPVLLKHLQTARHPVLRDGLARALTVPEARGPAADIILRELQREPTDPQVRWALANALTVVADPSHREQIDALVQDPAYEDVRERLQVASKTCGRKMTRRSPRKVEAAQRFN